MDIFDSLQISASGLNSQRAVIRVIAENMANVQTTRTEEGGPYCAKRPSYHPRRSLPSRPLHFPSFLRTTWGGNPWG